MTGISEKQKLYILYGIFGIAGILFYYQLLLKPQFSGFIAKNREYCAIAERVKKEEKLIADEANINRQYDNLKKQAGYLEKRLPNQDQVSSLLEDFSIVAESSGVKILRLKPLEESGNTAKSKSANALYSEFPILIEARAGYHQLGYFVNKVENMDRFIKVTEVDISGNDRDPRHHTIKMRIITYVLQ